jgi:hypothetical protein
MGLAHVLSSVPPFLGNPPTGLSWGSGIPESALMTDLGPVGGQQGGEVGERHHPSPSGAS